jgi:PelA/Pel-15E family pectate lyase
VAGLVALAACRQEPTAAAPVDSTTVASMDTTPLLDVGRIARLGGPLASEWRTYVATSAQRAAGERAAIDAELKSAGLATTIAAPRVDADFAVTSTMTDAWLRGSAGLATTASILSYQTPSGGWGKHVDFTQGPRARGQSYNGDANSWEYIGTLDNGATTGEMQYLARAFVATGDTVTRFAFLQGLSYLGLAQMPNGCWPQIFPLQGGYHDAATYNDDAITHALTLLRDVSAGASPYAFVPVDVRARAGDMLARGLQCVVATPVVVNGVKTAWGQQHDPLTLAPTRGRSYEPPGISGSESASLVRFLMTLDAPTPAVTLAVHAAADWFRATQITGYVYDAAAGTYTAQAGAGPLWARIAEIGTNRPIFANRDGLLLYDFAKLTDRRTGYTWFGTWPKATLATYDTWAKTHPRPAAAR